MVKKILGTLTLITSFVWFAFFLNCLDQGEYYFIFLISGIINILLIAKTKFWKESIEKTKGINIIRFLFIIINISLFLILTKMLKSGELDLNDSDNVYLSILWFFSILTPLIYLLKTKNNNR